MNYKTGTIYLSSSDGTPLEIPECKLSKDDINYVQSLEVYRKAQRRVIFHTYHFLPFTEVTRNSRPSGACASPRSLILPQVLRLN